MILVDVYVPSVGNTYDFQVNEDVCVSNIIDEIVELVGQKEKTGLIGNTESLCLCTRKNKKILNPKNTLLEYQVSNGDNLILV